jgi:hypothetical protein
MSLFKVITGDTIGTTKSRSPAILASWPSEEPERQEDARLANTRVAPGGTRRAAFGQGLVVSSGGTWLWLGAQGIDRNNPAEHSGGTL